MDEGMVLTTTETLPQHHATSLQRLDQSIQRVVLDRQDPISGLLPASTAHTIHGNYGDAWVRDCVYSVQCVWGLALAHKRQQGESSKRSWELEQRVLALMRGLMRKCSGWRLKHNNYSLPLEQKLFHLYVKLRGHRMQANEVNVSKPSQ